MADTIQHDSAEAEQDGFARVDLLPLCDGLANDRRGLRAIHLAVLGLQDSGIDKRDLDAISELFDHAEDSLEERQGQAEEIREAWAEHGDAEALRRPAKGYWHRDSQLVDAWKEWQATMRAYKECPESESADRYEVVRAVEKSIQQMHARTPIGLAVKLRHLFAELELSPAAQDALVYGEPMTDDLLQNDRERLAWQVVQIAERLARPAGRA